MNRQFDVIIIGDSKAGNEAMTAIAAKSPTIKIAFISREFKTTTTRDFLNVEYIKEEATFTDYKNRLFGCYLKNGDRYYCTHLIIATGLKYDPLFTSCNRIIPNVYHSLANIPKSSKRQPAIVVGNDSDLDIKFALAIAKKYKQVYFCFDKATFLAASKTNVKKLVETENLVVLPNASVRKVSTKDNSVYSIELDTYSKLTCSAIFAKTYAQPDVAFVSDKLIGRCDEYLEVSKNAESLLVPKCYAIGECAKKSTKKMRLAMVEDILHEFKGGQ